MILFRRPHLTLDLPPIGPLRVPANSFRRWRGCGLVLKAQRHGADPGRAGAQWRLAQVPAASDFPSTSKSSCSGTAIRSISGEGFSIGTLGDGRRVSVPIDQVEIRYTGTNPL